MNSNNLYNLTGALSLGFGIYCIAMAVMIVAFEVVAFFILFALIFLVMGILYTVAGISILRKGRMGFMVFFGFFGSTFWWGSGIPYYIWPMIIMPIVIACLFVLLFMKQFSGEGE